MSRGDNSPVRYVAFAASLVIGTAVAQQLLNTHAAKARRAGAKLPPGPKQEFLVGNLRNFPKDNWAEAFKRWKDEFGDIVYLNLIGQPIIVISSLDIVEELLNRRANIYSGRPFLMMSELMNLMWMTVNAQPGPTLIGQRKVIRKAIGRQVISKYDDVFRREAIQLAERLSGFSGDPRPFLADSIGGVILKLSYGEKIFQEHGKVMIEANRKRAHLTSWVYSRAWMVNSFPILQYVPTWFPGATFRQIAKEGTRVAATVRSFAYDLVENDIKNGIADDSIVSTYISDPGTPKYHLRDATSTLYASGSESTTSSIVNFLYILTLYPQVQQKIQEELDEHVGGDHSILLLEVENLSYLNAAWKETMRRYPTAPFGVPHTNTEANVWNGYYIPKGSMVYANVSSILRDPRVWGEDAEQFNPNRFLPEFNPNANNLPDMSMIPFGFGNRICPGRHLAERTALLFVTAILSAYRVTPTEEQKNSAPLKFAEGVVSRPINFQCTFVPRH